MDVLDFYSPDYTTARRRFRELAEAAGFSLEALELELDAADGSPLTIDMAWLGPRDAERVVVLSSGTHGVEGFFGSAVQLAVLTRPELLVLPEGAALLLIHAINPFGFDRIRRVNEDGVDLNRNFLLEGQEYTGSPEGYAALNGLLNPPSPPQALDPFLLKVGLKLVRHGMPALKAAVATGQYDFSQGLFFGGSRPSSSREKLAEALPRYLAKAKRVVHLDLHTGSGRWGTYILAVSDDIHGPKFAWQQQLFGADNVEGLDPSGVLYEIRGVLGAWCQQLLSDVEYHCLLAEFGTRWVFEVITALRQENRAWLHTTAEDPRRLTARARLKEAFCPADEAWRRDMLEVGVGLLETARAHLAAE